MLILATPGFLKGSGPAEHHQAMDSASVRWKRRQWTGVSGRDVFVLFGQSSRMIVLRARDGIHVPARLNKSGDVTVFNSTNMTAGRSLGVYGTKNLSSVRGMETELIQ